MSLGKCVLIVLCHLVLFAVNLCKVACFVIGVCKVYTNNLVQHCLLKKTCLEVTHNRLNDS